MSPFLTVALTYALLPSSPALQHRLADLASRLPATPTSTRRAAQRRAAPSMTDSDGADLALLSKRIDELKSVQTIKGLVLPEVLLPGQRMRLSLMAPDCADLACTANETVIGALGTHRARVLSHGVQAHVTELQRECSDSGYGDAYRWSATLVGGRVFERQVPAEVPDGRVFSGEVRWLDLGLSDTLASARRPPSRTVELAARELAPLVEQWLELARGGGSTLWGKPRAKAASGQGDAEQAEAVVGRMLTSLGPMPGAEVPSERAIWVAALICPFGARGPAPPSDPAPTPKAGWARPRSLRGPARRRRGPRGVAGARHPPGGAHGADAAGAALGGQDGAGRLDLQAQGRQVADGHLLLAMRGGRRNTRPPYISDQAPQN